MSALKEFNVVAIEELSSETEDTLISVTFTLANEPVPEPVT